MDIVFLCETWLTEEICITTHLQQRGFAALQVCGDKPISRGRPSGGLLCFFNKNFYEIDNIMLNKNFIILRLTNLNIIISFVYLNFEMDLRCLLQEIGDEVSSVANKYTNSKILYCGDFNSRMGDKNCYNSLNNDMLESSCFSLDRDSVDDKVNQRGLSLLDFMESEGLIMLNGRSNSDNPAQYTFVADNRAGESVIDHAWVNSEALIMISDLRVRNDVPTNSDHLPVEIIVSQCPKQSFSKIKYKSIKWSPEIKNEYMEYLNSLDEIDLDTLSSTEITEYLRGAIYSFADNNNLVKKFCKQSFCWWSDLISES